jgi:hypothetical protein
MKSAEGTNEMTHEVNRTQYNSSRSDVSPSLPSENENAQVESKDNMGFRDETQKRLHNLYSPFWVYVVPFGFHPGTPCCYVVPS